MYIPKPYRIEGENKIIDMIREIGLATLVCVGDDAAPVATHTPIEVIRQTSPIVLEGHIAKANKQWTSFTSNDRVLAIFMSPVHHYISSSWYSVPEVPTWNYMSVHVKGKIELVTEKDELWAMLKRLTSKYESQVDEALDLDSLPKHVKDQVNGIVGFRIKVENMFAAIKLSQTRSAKDHQNIISELRKKSTPIADLMANKMKEVGHL